MAVAASGYMAIVIDFAGLVTARREAYPRTYSSGFPEVVGIFDGSSEGGCSDRAHAGDGHEYTAGLALTGVREQLATELCGTDAKAQPGIQHRQHDISKILMIDKKAANVLLKRASLACGNDQTESLHDAADLVGKLGGHPDQPGARRDKRAG